MTTSSYTPTSSYVSTKTIREITDIVFDNIQDKFNEKDAEIYMLRENIRGLEGRFDSLTNLIKKMKSDMETEKDPFKETV